MYPSSHAAIFKKESKAKNVDFIIEKVRNNNSGPEKPFPNPVGKGICALMNPYFVFFLTHMTLTDH